MDGADDAAVVAAVATAVLDAGACDDLVNAFVPTFADVALPVGAFVAGAVLPTIINITRLKLVLS